MTKRIWDGFLTPQDRAHTENHSPPPIGVGRSPALLLVDLYRGAFGDQPQPLLESVKLWPASCGLAGWAALPSISRLLNAAREARIPVVHVAGSDAIPGWRGSQRPTQNAGAFPDADDRRRRRYELMPEVGPLPGEAVLRKSAPSAFWGTPLLGHLLGLGVDTVFVAGESTSGCVRATVVDARSYRLKVIVVEDCVFDRHEAAHAINLFDMSQKYADVIGLDEALPQLRRFSNVL